MPWCKRLRPDHWTWVAAKLSLVWWGVLYLWTPPEGPLEELGTILNFFVIGFCIIGAITSLVGLVISTEDTYMRRYRGYQIELIGLVLAICGPLSYSITQGLLIHENIARRPLSEFAFALTMFMVARLTQVWVAMRKDL